MNVLFMLHCITCALYSFFLWGWRSNFNDIHEKFATVQHKTWPYKAKSLMCKGGKHYLINWNQWMDDNRQNLINILLCLKLTSKHKMCGSGTYMDLGDNIARDLIVIIMIVSRWLDLWTISKIQDGWRRRRRRKWRWRLRKQKVFYDYYFSMNVSINSR